MEIVGSNPIGVATGAGEFLSMDFHPPEELHGEIVTLRRYRLTDHDALKAAIAASLEELRDWMPWAQEPPTDASVASFLEPAVERFGGDAAANYAIMLRDGGQFAGGCGLMPRIGPGALEIGYWVHSGYHRRGIATESARLLTNVGLAARGCAGSRFTASRATPRAPRWRGAWDTAWIVSTMVRLTRGARPAG